MKFFSLKFPSLTSMIIFLYVCSSSDWQCKTYGSLRTVAKQFSVNIAYLLYQHSEYTAFDYPNKTNMMIIAVGGGSITMAI